MMFLKQKFKVGTFITACRSFPSSVTDLYWDCYLFVINCDLLASKIVNQEEIIILNLT